jgi:predicted RNase H-like nuclease (RuvC/YqgF family)
MVELMPTVRSLLDVECVQTYQIMLDKLKKGIIAFNKSTITDKLNFIIQNIMQDNEQFNQHYNVAKTNHKRLIKKSESEEDSIVISAKQLKKDLIRIKKQLFELYEEGENLAEKTKELLNHHAKNSVLKRIKNIKTVARWLNNDDSPGNNLMSKLDEIIHGNS